MRDYLIEHSFNRYNYYIFYNNYEAFMRELNIVYIWWIDVYLRWMKYVVRMESYRNTITVGGIGLLYLYMLYRIMSMLVVNLII